MSTGGNFEWSTSEFRILRSFTSPFKIQQYLDSIEYSAESRYRSPHSVLRDRKAHCFDGAVFAAAMLKRLGYPPMIVDMQAVRDDDHVIAIFKRNGKVGAVAKSNFVGLRFREPIYRDVRELVMSFFPSFYNMNKEYSLRQFTVPLHLGRYKNFEFDDEVMEAIGLKLSYIPVTKLMTPSEIRSLQKVDQRTFKAGMIGAVKKGIYQP
ncbi:MAG: transglutaminase domain-containing protein [Ignavibacteriales bacterium]|nr:transglutaminase domain-containing protein [Ignavibacteriales bacterium]